MDNRCPYCGIELQNKANGELFCPNHGIIKQGYECPSEETPSYCS